MGYRLPNIKTSENLKRSLMDFFGHHEFLTATVRQSIQYIADILNYSGDWVAMSIEEAIVRNHYDHLGSEEEPRARERDFFYHTNLLINLGRVANRRELARPYLNLHLKTLVEAGILKITSSGTALVNPRLTIDESVNEVRRKINAKRT